MSQRKSFPLNLGGRTWTLYQFKFGIIMHVQPTLIVLSQRLFSDGADGLAGRLDEKALDELADLALAGVRSVDPDMTREALDQLPITTAELIASIPQLFGACGLTAPESAAAESAPVAAIDSAEAQPAEG